MTGSEGNSYYIVCEDLFKIYKIAGYCRSQR
jgi:hypothetical protein